MAATFPHELAAPGALQPRRAPRWRPAAHLACGLIVPLIGLTAAHATDPGSAKHPLGLDQFLSAVHQDGRLALPAPPDVAWAGNDQIIFTSPRSRTPRLIYAARLDGTTRVVATGSGPRLSAGGRYLAYIDPAGDLAVATLGEGAARTVATLKRRESSEGIIPASGTYGWQTGGDRLVYLKYHGQRTDIGSLDFVQPTQPEVHVFDPATGADRIAYSVSLPRVDDPLTFAPTAIGALAMAKDGTIYLTEGSGSIKTGMSASLKAVKNGQVRTIARVGNFSQGLLPYVSPDGRTITMEVSRDPDYLTYVGTEYRGLIDVATGKTRIVQSPYPVWSTASWSADSRSVTYICKTGALANRLCVAGRSKAEDRVLAPLETLSEIKAFAISPDGRHMAWMSRDLTDTARLTVSGTGPSPRQTLWTDALIPTDTLALGETRTVRWKSADGLVFEGLLTVPPGYKSGRLPLLVDIHGGPNGGVRAEGSLLGGASPLEAQIWAGMGYAYFQADYREGFIADQSPDILRIKPGTAIYEANARDVLAGIDMLVDAGIADPKRIAGLGHSMGAVTLASLLTITDRLAVGVAKEGLEDWSILPGIRDPAANPADLKTRMWAWRVATLDDVRRVAAEGSAISHADAIKTPVLVIKSSPSAERNAVGRAFVDAVNKAGGDARLLTFADDYHLTVREANTSRIAHEIVNWINVHLGMPTPPN